MAKTLIGLEITEESVRAAEVTNRRSPSLLSAGEVPLPPGAAKDSEILDADAVALALRQLWARAGFRGRRVVLGAGGRRIIVREHTTPTMRPDLFRRALPFQVQDLLPVPVDQAVLDFLPVTSDGDHTTGLLVAGVAETLEELVSTCGRAKLVVDRIDAVPFALARTVRARSGTSGEVTAAVHIGDHTTHLVIVDDALPRFVRIMPVDLPTSAVRARRAQEREEAAQEARVPVGVGAGTVNGTETPAGGIHARIAAVADDGADDPAVHDLVGRIRDTIAFHEGRPGMRPVSAVQVSGAGSAVPGVVAGLAGTLAAAVSIVTAADMIGGSVPGDALGEHSRDLVTTIGLVTGVAR